VGINQSKYLVAGTLAETLANVLFDYLLIYGKMGLPALGFNGAAVASVIAEFTGMFVVYLVIHREGIGRRFGLFSSLRFQKHNNRLILQMSAPLMFQHGISIVSWQFFFLLMSHHGNQALQISNAMRNFLGFFGSFSWALAATTNAMVANVIGQGREDWVRPLLGRIIRLSLGFSLLAFALVNAVPQAILAIYGQDASFVAAAIPVVRVVTVAMLLISFSTVYLNAVTGTGQSKVAFAIELFAIVMYCIYVYLVVGYWHLSVAWGWMSEWVYWICLFVPAWWYMRSGRWQGRVV
jgi:Na+-driven multidrug efflux pump